MLSIATAYRRVGEVSEHLRKLHDDSASGVVKYRNTSRDSTFDRFGLPIVGYCPPLPPLRGLHEEEVYVAWFAAGFDLDSFGRLRQPDSFPYLLAYDWCTYHSQMCMVVAERVSGRFKEEQ